MIDRFQVKGAGSSALVVIDVQTRMVQALAPKVVRRNVGNMALLLEAARALAIPILVTEHYPQGLGPTIESLGPLLAGARTLEKIVFSGTGAPGFREALRATGREHIVLIGTETHVCVAQTALDLLAEGYHVHVPSDAVLSRFTDDWQGGLAFMRQAGAVVTRTETLVFQWLERAGTEVFRRLSPRIKNRSAE
ncbi:MAG: isochorismatase family protein [Planctomycetes bacterium]|nr:isochorismatase family protein [Planctomycetota bacterium]